MSAQVTVQVTVTIPNSSSEFLSAGWAQLASQITAANSAGKLQRHSRHTGDRSRTNRGETWQSPGEAEGLSGPGERLCESEPGTYRRSAAAAAPHWQRSKTTWRRSGATSEHRENTQRSHSDRYPGTTAPIKLQLPSVFDTDTNSGRRSYWVSQWERESLNAKKTTIKWMNWGQLMILIRKVLKPRDEATGNVQEKMK